MINVAIVDDHTIFRKSLKVLLEDFEDISVILEAHDGTELLEKLSQVQPHIVLLDIHLPFVDGFETCRILVRDYPNILIAMLSGLDDMENIQKGLKLGAHGYLSKNVEPEELYRAMVNLSNDGYYIEESLSLMFRKYIEEETVSPKKEISFSKRQLEILQLGVQGLKSREIALQLGISVKTIDIHKGKIMDKLDATTFTNAVFYALTHGIITASALK